MAGQASDALADRCNRLVSALDAKPSRERRDRLYHLASKSEFNTGVQACFTGRKKSLVEIEKELREAATLAISQQSHGCALK